MKQSTEIMKDPVRLEVFVRFNYATSCEDCSHFDELTEGCTFGYPTEPFLKRNQMRDLETKGKMAFCRAQEID